MVYGNDKHLGHGSRLINDFTTGQYAALLSLAKVNYEFIGYDEPSKDQSILWRHDCDFSLNRALHLAKLEQSESVKTTYFINPHCEFYNPFEKKQSQLVKNILNLGHDLGLHFDAEFYDIDSEEQLEDIISLEADWLQRCFDTRLTAFSFHNPTDFLLSCDRDSYGGLINCYSAKLKQSASYCSDSNGYWRYRRLRDVLEEAKEPRLQVLTHPGWWQEKPCFPRQRIFRSVYGRASAVLDFYDSAIKQFGRTNLGGPVVALQFLRELDLQEFEICDYLWNRESYSLLFAELWGLHERQVCQLCRAELIVNWYIPECDVNEFFESVMLVDNCRELFGSILGCSWVEASGNLDDRYQECLEIADLAIHQVSKLGPGTIQSCCVYLCESIQNIAQWGRATERPGLDGFNRHIVSSQFVDSQSRDSEAVNLINWKALKSQFQTP